jgi:Tol biopolymer transport system component
MALAALVLAACAAPQTSVQTPAAQNQAPRIISTLEIYDLATGQSRIVLTAGNEIGAPNFTRDGRDLIFNSDRDILLISTTDGAPRTIHTVFSANGAHDHGPSPDGTQIAISDYDSNNVSFLHLIPSEGGPSRRLTENGPSYFHGWSPDGTRIAFTAQRGDANFDVYDIDVATGAERRLTSDPAFDDGADYGPDGTMYFSSSRSGAVHIWKMNQDGSNPTQVTSDAATQDWFPHPSPDGRWLLFLATAAGKTPFDGDQEVAIRILPLDGSAPQNAEPRTLLTLAGGNGTLNAPPWAPESSAFAFVRRQLIEP